MEIYSAPMPDMTQAKAATDTLITAIILLAAATVACIIAVLALTAIAHRDSVSYSTCRIIDKARSALANIIVITIFFAIICGVILHDTTKTINDVSSYTIQSAFAQAGYDVPLSECSSCDEHIMDTAVFSQDDDIVDENTLGYRIEDGILHIIKGKGEERPCQR